jgi:hypothetical protein
LASGESAATQEKVGNAPDAESAEYVALDAFDAMATWIASQADIARERIRAAGAQHARGRRPGGSTAAILRSHPHKPEARRNTARGVSDEGTFVPM